MRPPDAHRRLVATRVRAALEAHGVSQARLAGRLGVSKNTLSNWIVGNNDFAAAWLPQIADELGTSLPDLLDPESRDRGAKEAVERTDDDLDLAARLSALAPIIEALATGTPDLMDVLREAQSRVRQSSDQAGS